MDIASNNFDARSNLDALRLGYLSCPRGASDDFLGGLLVVDGRGRPKHFAYVDPVRPTRAQQLLYSDTLAPAAKIDTIAKGLLATLQSQLHALFINDDTIKEVQRLVEAPVIHLATTKKPKDSIANYNYTLCNEGTHFDFVHALIGAVNESLDLLEPFERITLALKESYKAHFQAAEASE